MIKIGLILACCTLAIFCQSETCYVNCLFGYCERNNSLSCTRCDKGLVNIAKQCIGSDTQPEPFTKYKPLQSNFLGDLNGQEIVCQIQQANIILGTMVFQKVQGRTLTQRFVIDTQHDYIQVKFNAIKFSNNTTAQLQYKIRTNDITLVQKTSAIVRPQNNTQNFVCDSKASSYPYYIVEKISNSAINIILDITLTDAIDSQQFGVAYIELYYGICNAKCQKCSGSTDSQCLSCRGFYLNNTNNMCQTCPQKFYDEGQTCLGCPPQCITCNMTAQGRVNCITCDLKISNSTTNCTLFNYNVKQFQTKKFSQNQGWSSTQFLGSPITECGLYSLVGGNLIGRAGSFLTKTFENLPVHRRLWIKFNLFLIDQQPNSLFQYNLYIDDNQNVNYGGSFRVELSNNQYNFTNECGQANLIQYIRNIAIYDISQANTTLSISIQGLSSYFGIRDFTLGIVNDTEVQNCYRGNQGQCLQCFNGFQLVNNTCDNCPSDSYQVNNKCQICPIQCLTCVWNNVLNSVQCLTCSAPLTLTQSTKRCLDSSGQRYTFQILPNYPININLTTNEPSKIKTAQPNFWTSYPKLLNQGWDTCNGKYIIGSSTIQYRKIYFTRIFSGLPGHEGISIIFHFYQIDDFANDNSVYFKLDGQRIEYTPKNQKLNLCGNTTLDAITKISIDRKHSSSVLTFEIYADRMVKLGINNFQLFLIGCNQCSNTINYKIQAAPIYSVQTPPNKGIFIKYVFDQPIENNTDLKNVFMSSLSPSSSRRLLQTSQNRILNEDFIRNRQFRILMELNQTYIDSVLKTTIDNQEAVTINNANRVKIISTQPKSIQFPRYDDIKESDTEYRTHIKNFRNLLRGCALFGMFLGLISFLVGMSSAFDDFFLMTQVIFVHIFIHYLYNPVTFKIPVGGMQLTQFMAWLPYQARMGIEDGIVAPTLYQYSPIAYEQYYQDVVFIRAIYNTLIFFGAMIILFAILKIWANTYIPQLQVQYNYLRTYYYKEQLYPCTFLDKVVRFGYFTVVWACILQFLSFKQDPTSFNIWNSILCIFCFVIACLYPIALSGYLYWVTTKITKQTFEKHYYQLRTKYNGFWWILPLRYYYFIAVAALIAPLWNTNPLSSLIPLAVIHILYGVFILVYSPFGMKQTQKIQVICFNRYPRIYQITSAIQYFLLALLEILMIITFGINKNGTSSYLSIGYVMVVVIILLFVNAFVRLGAGLQKQFENCWTENLELNLKIDKNKANIEKIEAQQAVLKQAKQFRPKSALYLNEQGSNFRVRSDTKKISFARQL